MITPGPCTIYLRDIQRGVHLPGDTYKLAIYTADANLSKATTSYITAHEVKGKGYPPGGVVLTGIHFDEHRACMSFDDACVPKATITARGGLIYNASKGNRAVAVTVFLDDDGKPCDVSSTAAPFDVCGLAVELESA